MPKLMPTSVFILLISIAIITEVLLHLSQKVSPLADSWKVCVTAKQLRGGEVNIIKKSHTISMFIHQYL